ncbi:hypothetical protein [Knoellia koreensis]|uniref:Uncharacterized protein n=1 Tax=Knoellia koreensis TaxID=2730921 RepID=A0A849HL69_9MICO|nr:hypothetical protein [Knoellia sp. DB2414S]NNM45377.1 hypothetical protein [Knoellia sp. DB2414S]
MPRGRAGVGRAAYRPVGSGEGKALKDNWIRWGLEPLPRMAPPHSHVLGMGRMVVAGFDLDSADWEEVGEDWRVDTAATVVGDTPLRVGDIVVWLGPDETGGADRMWPPSLVVEVGRVRAGRQRVSALAFDRHESIGLDEVDELARGRATDHVQPRPRVVTGDERRLLLGLWNLDVTCPTCGGFGRPIQWGLPIPRWSDTDGGVGPTSPEDPGQHYLEGGCVVSSERFQCSRCGTSWPQDWHAAGDGPAGEE